MNLKDIFDKVINEITVEGLGTLFCIGVVVFLVFGGGLGEIAKLFAQAFCG